MYYFAKFAEHKFANFAWKLNSMQVPNKSMLESAQQIKKIELDDYVFDHQWFRVTNIVLHNLQNTNSTILPTKTPPGNPTNDQWLSTKKKLKKKKKKEEKEK